MRDAYSTETPQSGMNPTESTDSTNPTEAGTGSSETPQSGTDSPTTADSTPTT
jgi:hypothetical protein